MDPEIKRLVCDNCWITVFSAEPFREAFTCSESFTTESEAKAGLVYTTPSWEAMQRSINFMCEWCDLLCEEILFYYHRAKKNRQDPPPEATFRVAVRFQKRTPDSPLCLNITVEDGWSPSRLVFTTPEDNASRYITERGVLDKLDAPASHALAKQCIRECESHHACCIPPARATLPTRVIDCTDPDHPRLFITQGAPPDYYVVLSYVWGEAQPYRTTAFRLSTYIELIDTNYIPTTIRDAIKVTHALGFRYLWVDAFCIIQDSDEDKATEIARIRSIFRHAYVTIIAANAKKVSDGFLNRILLYNTPSTLPFRCPDDTIGTMRVQNSENAPREPVNTRAWCLEERVLSARALWYCSHTIQYECQHGHVNVDESKNMDDPLDGVPRLPDRVFTPDLPTLAHISDADAEREVCRAWANILRLYSRRALTRPRDRLVALSGVAEYFQAFWSRSRYLAGLWEHQLPGCLLWYKTGGKDLTARPAEYRAPSWSWAAVDGEIHCESTPPTSALCAVQRCYTVPKRDTNPFGEVIAGVLLIEIILRQAVWNTAEGELYELEGSSMGTDDEYRSERCEIGYVTVDAVEDISSAACGIYAAPLTQTSSALLGIILIPVESTIALYLPKDIISTGLRTFRRVGWFTAPFCDRDVWLHTSRQAVQIV